MRRRRLYCPDGVVVIGRRSFYAAIPLSRGIFPAASSSVDLFGTPKVNSAPDPSIVHLEINRKLETAYLRVAKPDDAGLEGVTEADLNRASDELEQPPGKWRGRKPPPPMLAAIIVGLAQTVGSRTR